jgi:hypothetical protein
MDMRHFWDLTCSKQEFIEFEFNFRLQKDKEALKWLE